MAKIKPNLSKKPKKSSNWEIVDIPIAQTGTQTGYSWSTQQAPSYQPTFQGNYASSKTTGNRALTSKEMQALKVYNEKRVQEQKEAEYAARQAEYQQRQARIKESVDAQNQPLSAQNIMTQSQSTGDKMSLAMNTPFGNPTEYPTLSGYVEGLDFINPLKSIGDMASGLGAVPYNVQQGNYGQALMGVAAPLAVGALAGIGTQGIGQFTNNLVNPFAGFGNPLKRKPNITSSVDDVSRGLDLEELRRVYHNSKRFLQPEESRFLHKHGHGLRENYRTDMSDYGWGTDQWNVNNQLAPPPSEIQMMPDGTTRTIYNQQPITDYVSGSYRPDYIDLRRPPTYNRDLLSADYANLVNGYPANNYPNLTREQIEQAWRSLDSHIQTTPKPKKLTNKSGLTKEEAIAKASSKDKDVISKMSETEFENTVLKPTGEVVPYESQADLMPHFTGNNNVSAMSPKEYADAFNERLDLLNDIIAKNNKSGVEYRVKELTPDGELKFITPKQKIEPKLTSKQKENLEWYERNPEDFAINKGGLKQTEDGNWIFENLSDDVFKTKEEALKFLDNEVNINLKNATIEGESAWGVRLNPGQWEGNVEDIANTNYLRSIPGLEMSNSSAGVFADRVPRKGTAAYKSINEYLKKLNLGRVKAGFNSQSDFSRPLWENAIKSGEAVGFYNNPRTVYGTMKSVFPYIGIGGAGALGATQAKNEPYKNGGKINSNWEIMQEGGKLSKDELYNKYAFQYSPFLEKNNSPKDGYGYDNMFHNILMEKEKLSEKDALELMRRFETSPLVEPNKIPDFLRAVEKTGYRYDDPYFSPYEREGILDYKRINPKTLTPKQPVGFIEEEFKNGGQIQDQKELKIKKSTIEGKGLFANKSFLPNEVIGTAHIDGQPTKKIGMFHNHSENPNTESIIIGNKRILKPLKKIKKGEEITVNYRNQPELEQPENFYFPESSVTEYPLPEAGSGYKVVRSSERKGKTHKVIGPDGTVKFFGDSKLGQHPKDPARKKAFYARHKKNLAGNPYFRAFARKTWEEGGELNDWEILDTAQDGRSLTSSELASRFRPEDAYQRSPIKFENIGNKSYGFGIRPNNFNISGVLDLQNKENPTFRTALGYNKNGLNINIAPSFSKDKKEAIFTAGYDGRDWSGNLMYQDPSKFNLGFGYNKAGFSGNANYERQGKNNVFNTSIGYEGEDVPINAGLDYTYDNGHYASANLGFNAKNIRGGFNYDYDQSEKANRFGLNLGTNFGKNKKWAFDTSANFDTDKNYKINTGLKYNFKSGGMLPDLNVMAFGGNLILEKYQDGGSNWEILPDNEWEII